MGEPKTVEEIETGYSKSQVYWRIKKLVENGLMDPPRRGDRNQYLLTQKDVRLLQRLAQLEKSNDTVEGAIEQLEKVEVQKGVDEELKRRVEKLENKTQVLENELAAQKDRLKHPGRKWIDKIKQGFKKALNWLL